MHMREQLWGKRSRSWRKAEAAEPRGEKNLISIQHTTPQPQLPDKHTEIKPGTRYLGTYSGAEKRKMPKPKKPDPKSQRVSSKPPVPTPNWPPLRPLLPTADLSLVPLVPDQIYIVRNFLPTSLCKNYASFFASLPLTTTPGKPKKDEAVRVNDRFQIEDAQFAENLWSGTALKELVTERFAEEEDYKDEDEDESGPQSWTPDQRAEKARQVWGGKPLGLNANIRIYRYSAGQFFAQHCMFSSWSSCLLVCA